MGPSLDSPSFVSMHNNLRDMGLNLARPRGLRRGKTGRPLLREVVPSRCRPAGGGRSDRACRAGRGLPTNRTGNGHV